MRTHTKRSTATPTRLTTCPGWSSRRTWFACLGVLVMLVSSPAMAQDTQWDAGTGDWFNVSNWDPVLPSDTVSAAIDNGGTAQVESTGAETKFLYVGDTTGNSGWLDIINGGELTTAPDGTDYTSVIAHYGSTSGGVVVDGTGSLWNNLGHTFVGNQGSGTLTISDGGRVNTGHDFILGRYSTASGTLNIGDGGAAGILDTASVDGGDGGGDVNFNHTDSDYWFTSDGTADGDAVSITGDVEVNHQNTGTTTLAGEHDYTGQTRIDLGTLRLDDADLTTSRVRIGHNTNDDGTLEILNGSVLTSGQANLGADYSSIAAQADTTGAVLVDGAGSTWTSPADLFVGDRGDGTLTITHGGVVENGYGFVGNASGSEGAVLVDGEGSTWTNNQWLYVGGWASDADGELTIANDGVVNVGGEVILAKNSGSTGIIHIGDGGGAGVLNASRVSRDGNTAGGSTAQINFNHTDSNYWFTTDGTADGGAIELSDRVDITHNNAGTTTLTGQVTDDDYTGIVDVDRGALRFDDATFESTLYLRVGTQLGDEAAAVLANGSQVTVESVELAQTSGADSTLTVTGENTTLTTDWLYPGWQGEYTLNVADGGTIVVADDASTNNGQFTVDGEGSSVTTNQWIVGAIAQAEDIMNVTNGGKVTSQNNVLAFHADATATLNIGDGGGAGIIDTATIHGGDGDATLNFNHTDENYHLTTDGTADGTNVGITGSATVNHVGTGKTTLDGTHTYTGDTNVNAGWLHLPGSIAGDANIADNGRLSGAGTIGGGLANAGQLSPGNSIGTMTVTGDYDHLADATLDIEINDAGATPGVNNDLLDVAGVAYIQGGTVNVIAEPGDYSPGTQYTFLDADGGLTGTFTGATHDLNNLFTAELGYTPNTAYVELALLPSDYEGIGTNANERGIGRHLDETYLDSFADMADFYNELGGLDDDEARNAMQQLSGETIGAGTSAVAQNIHRTQGVLLQRVRPTGEGARSWPTRPLATASNNQTLSLAAADDDELGEMIGDMHTQRLWVPWVQGYGEYGDVSSSAASSGFNYTTGGALFGVDRNVSDNWLVGAYGGYGRSNVDSDFGRQDLDIDHLQLGAHARYERGAWYGIGSIFAGYQRYDSGRRVQVGNITERAEAGYNGGQFGTALEIGRTYALDAWTLQPLAGLQYTFLHREGFTETGAPNANLTVGSEDTHSLRSSLGINVSRLLHDRRESQVLGQLRARWMHEFADDSGSTTARFAGSGADAFTVDSADLGRDTAMLGAGIDWRISNTTSLAFNYDAEFNDRFVTHHGSVALRFVW